ncbi:hypothetical protein [Microbacterium sp. SCN 71-21]|nr:hypothetical protein [Microbacterium sp. SCN 71-21]
MGIPDEGRKRPPVRPAIVLMYVGVALLAVGVAVLVWAAFAYYGSYVR